MAAPCLMVQGTASEVGKSVLVTALCRIFARAGRRVAPFKSQNMSLNAAVTPDGGEIGRAQAVQAEAAGLEPTVDMNPILLKPGADGRSQVVVRGVARATAGFAEYGAMAPALLEVARQSLARLRATHDLVLIEGAGSPAEINFRDTEIVNMRVARLADAPVLLIGDIERGGVFGAFVGTLALLDAADRCRVAGLVVNKFRGDPALLAPGLAELTARTGIPVLGVIPALEGAPVPSEDSLSLDRLARRPAGAVAVRVALVRLPRIASFDDFEPLAEEPGVETRLATRAADLAGADLVVLPGSKSTIADLAWLRSSGLADAVIAHAASGGAVLGVCGGYQMLGLTVSDPDGVESEAGAVDGLGLLPVRTVFEPGKTTMRVRARLQGAGPFPGAAGQLVHGYEIHSGRTTPIRPGVTWVSTVVARDGGAVEEPDGAVHGAVAGTYLHGLLGNGGARRALLRWLAHRAGRAAVATWGASSSRTARYDRLADVVAAAVNMNVIARLVGLRL